MSVLSMLAPPPGRPRPRVGADAPDPRRLDVAATERAVAAYEDARRFEADAWRLAEADHALDKWAGLAALARQEAEEILIAAILAWAAEVGEGDLPRASHVYHPGRGITLGAKVYLALPRTDFWPGDDPGGAPVMVLKIIDADSIATFEVK